MNRWLGPALRSLPWGNGLLAGLVAVFFLVRLGEAHGSAPGWVRNYGDDFLCLPLVLSLVLAIHRLTGHGSRTTLPVLHSLLALGIFAVYFEGVLPHTGSGSVADPLDVLMYLAGFLVFHFGLNRNVEERSDHADLPLMKFLPRATSSRIN
jgi:hypothetical protein